MVGTKGKLVSEGDELIFTETSIASDAAIRGEGELESKTYPIDVGDENAGEVTGSVEAGLGGNQHAKVMQNFCMAILDPEVTLISPGTDGINGVELGAASDLI